MNTHGDLSDIWFTPLEKHCVFSTGQKSWSFFDLEQGKNICTIPADFEVGSMGLHPDGLILSTGHPSGAISVWDIRNKSVFFKIDNEDMRGQAVKQLAFSNKGY